MSRSRLLRFAYILAFLAIILVGNCALGLLAQGTAPELPRQTVPTTYSQPGNVVTLTPSSNLQSAINAAPLGTTIILPAGATYSGHFTLPAKSGSGWIYIISDQLGVLPQGTRVTPSQTASLPRIVTPDTQPAFETLAGAHHYRLAGLEVASTYASTSQTTYSVVAFDGHFSSGGNQTLADVPHDLIVDRCYIHGNPSGNSRRGVTLNSASTAVIDSTVSEIHEVGQDSQALLGWNGPGPFLIQNNYLSASAENLQFGGADPGIANLIPSDITIRGNYLYKPLAWRTANWVVKNALEIKHGQRILIEGNRLENVWVGDQQGAALLLTVRNQSGGCPWCVVQDVTVRRNWTTHTGEGMRISGTDNDNPSQRTQRVAVTDNVFEDITDSLFSGGGGGLAIVITGSRFGSQPVVGPASVLIAHNTILPTTQLAVTDTGGAQQVIPGFAFQNNLVSVAGYGFGGGGTQDGNATLNGLYTSPVFTKNALVAGDASHYTGAYAGNFFPGSVSTLQFTSVAQHNYRLLSSSPYHLAGTDGQDLGPDYDALLLSQACTVSGVCNGAPPPPPPPADTTAPVVTFTAPAANATFTVNVPVTITRTATDNVAVVSQTLSANGSPITSPSSFSTPGIVTLLATAQDGAGNVGSATRTINIVSAPNPVDAVCHWQVSWNGSTGTITRVTDTPASNGGAACASTATVVIR